MKANAFEGDVLNQFYGTRMATSLSDISPRYREINERIVDIQERLNAAANQKTKALLEELDGALADAEGEAQYMFYHFGVADYAGFIAASTKAEAEESDETMNSRQVVERLATMESHYLMMAKISGILLSLAGDEYKKEAVVNDLSEILRDLNNEMPCRPSAEEIAAAAAGVEETA